MALNSATGRTTSTLQALKAFESLLAFDIKLQREVILDEFRRLKVNEYVQKSSIDELFAEFAHVPDAVELLMPKFMSVLRHAKNLATSDASKSPTWIKPFGELDLSNLSKVHEGPNHFIIEILRHLYASGFAAWVAERQDDAKLLKEAVDAVTRFKKDRATRFYSKDNRNERAYFIAESATDALTVEETTTFNDLFSELSSRAMSDDAIRRTYRAEPHE